MTISRIYGVSIFLLLIAVAGLQVLANFNLFNYPLSVLMPLIFIPLCAIPIFIDLQQEKFQKIHQAIFLWIAIVAMLLVIPALQNVFYENLVDQFNRTSISYVLTISALAVSWIFIGSVLGKKTEILLPEIIAISGMTLFSLYLMSGYFQGSIFVDYYYLNAQRGDDVRIQHLSLTEPLTFILYLFLSLGINTKYKWVFSLLFLFFFLSLGGRTAFFCSIFTLLIYEILSSNALSFFLKVAISVIVVSFSTGFITFNDNIFFDKLFFKGGLDSDQSFQGRVEYLTEFMDGFFDQVLIGYPNYFIEKHNDFGTYSHNILSLFQYYGVILFVVVLYAFAYIFKKIISMKIYKSSNVLDVFGILIFVYSLASVITGKSILFGPMWFVLGFWLFRFRNFVKEENCVHR